MDTIRNIVAVLHTDIIASSGWRVLDMQYDPAQLNGSIKLYNTIDIIVDTPDMGVIQIIVDDLVNDANIAFDPVYDDYNSTSVRIVVNSIYSRLMTKYQTADKFGSNHRIYDIIRDLANGDIELSSLANVIVSAVYQDISDINKENILEVTDSYAYRKAIEIIRSFGRHSSPHAGFVYPQGGNTGRNVKTSYIILPRKTWNVEDAQVIVDRLLDSSIYSYIDSKGPSPYHTNTDEVLRIVRESGGGAYYVVINTHRRV